MFNTIRSAEQNALWQAVGSVVCKSFHHAADEHDIIGNSKYAKGVVYTGRSGFLFYLLMEKRNLQSNLVSIF